MSIAASPSTCSGAPARAKRRGVSSKATDRRHRNLTVSRMLLDALRLRLAQGKPESPAADPKPVHLVPPAVNVINRLDMSLALEAGPYKTELVHAQGELGLLSRRLRKQQRSLILVFEGPDAAGKGGAIRRLTVGDGRPRLPGDLRRRARPTRSAPTPTSGGSGATCRTRARSPSTTAPGTAASWSSGSRGLPAPTSGSGPTRRSTSSRNS